jgi:cytochrome c-type biogenesis protein CcmE
MGTDGTFAGDRVLVKHTEQYRAENPGRVPDGAP